ncbi:Uncharacterised protein [Candidatus Norongarragalina meridionalis]|nr:Uncharacterised protein [Candidatus Norongarragalina meridionalis]
MARNKEEEWNGKCCGGHRRGAGKLIFGLFLLVMGVGWLGNEMGWWTVAIPWLPLAVTLIGAGMVVKWLLYRD